MSIVSIGRCLNYEKELAAMTLRKLFVSEFPFVLFCASIHENNIFSKYILTYSGRTFNYRLMSHYIYCFCFMNITIFLV